MCKLKKNSNVLEEMENKQDFKSNIDSCIRHVIRTMIQEHIRIWSAAQISFEVGAKLNVKIKLKDVYRILKKDFRMSFRQSNTITIYTNTVNNLILRQRFAIEYIKLANSGKVILNIDES